MRRVEFYRHNLGREEKDAVCRVLDSVFLTTGPKTAEFEQKFAEYLGVRHCVATTSCTMGAFLALKALGIGAGDEVITTPMTFIATANVILHAGATPVFVDVEPDTGNIDVRLVERAVTARTKAAFPVHLYGQMCDMEELKQIATRHGFVLLEDAAHCVEGMRGGKRSGQVGDAACFSFYATKNMA
ncbi:MAG: aminotransferase class I/II-fold pyridoxal phosphate-dependent enzyme, partial [Lentisphaerae bacterium]|nr:aminotransferase class I/II-fold pyridoxal phosphate-dependent enzyme [Lentisphaerota bacterium]